MNDRLQDNPLFVNSLEKGLRVLRAFDAAHPEMGVTEIARRTALDKSAAQRFSNTLCLLGYLEKDPRSRRYRPAIRCLDLAQPYFWADALLRIASPRVIELGNQLGETVNLARIDGGDIVYVIRIPNKRTSFAATLVGRRLPAPVTSSGRVLMARMPAEQVEAILAAWDRRAITPATLTCVEAVGREIAQAGAQGFCIAEEQCMLGEIGVAAPVVAPESGPVAAVQCSLSKSRWERERVVEEIVPHLIETANLISLGLTSNGL